MKRLAIIPARGGSKRIPQKNIKNFCGKPMISYVIETAKSTNLFEKIHVSTDCNKLADVSRLLSLPIDFMRPTNLADDYTPIMPVLKFVVEEYKSHGIIFDEVWLLMACNPLLKKDDLLKASKVYQNSIKSKSLLAIEEYPVPIEWAFKIDDKKNLIPIKPGAFLNRSQDIEKKYFDTGTFAIFSSETILKADQGSDGEYIGYLLPKFSSIDIDTHEDWSQAEKIFESDD